MSEEVKKITIAGEEIKITKLPFGKVLEVSGLLKSMKTNDKGEIILEAPEDFIRASETLGKVFQIALGKDEKWVSENIYMEDVGELLKAIIRENKFPLPAGQAEK